MLRAGLRRLPGLERPLSKTFDRAGWEKTVERMHDNGAEVNREERAQVVAYLLTKNTFEAKCSACHGTDRPLGKSKSAADWLATVQRMSGKKPGHLTEAEVADIAAYLRDHPPRAEVGKRKRGAGRTPLPVAVPARAPGSAQASSCSSSRPGRRGSRPW